MANVRSIILVVLFPVLTAVMSGQESPTPAPGLLISDVHADTSAPSSVIPLRGTDNGSYSEVVRFGVHPAATYCIDGELEPGLLETDLPPKPPAGVFDLRFTEHRSGSTCLINGLAVHMQEPGKLDTFKLEFQPGDGGYPMTLSWKDAAARIAADWESLVLKDGITGILVTVDMKVDTSVVITNSLINTLFIIGRTFHQGTRYLIDATAGAGGTIQPGGAVYVDSGESRSFTITPSPGNAIGGVFVDGVNVGPVGGYTFTNVTANHTIRATFTASFYQIEASAGTGGTISPGGPLLVPAGGNQTFIVQANPGYQTADVIVDGVAYGPLAQYTFTNVTAAHTIRATFTTNQYQITASAGTGGTISPGGTVLVPAGGNQTFIVQANPGYQTADVIVDGVTFGPLAQYIFTNVTAAHTIHATFTTNQYQITASAGTGGTISPGGTVLVPAGGNQTFIVQANPGYQTADVIVDGVAFGPLAQYAFTNVTAAHTIHATFTAHQYQITASAATGGTISPSGTVRVSLGGNQTFFIQADPGYQADNLIVDGVSYGPLARFSFTNVSANHSISAWFTPTGGESASSIVRITGHDAGTGIGVGTFGVHPNATYCLDGELVPGLREQELPPKPPAGVFDLRFTEHRSNSSCLGAGTRFHLQEPGKLDTFKIEIQSGNSGYPIALSWPAGLDSDWTTLVIRDGFGGILVSGNMLAQTSLLLTNPLINTLFIIGEAGSPRQSYSIDASAGPGGSITPQGLVTVNSGANRSFIAIPDPGFVVDSISVDGARVSQRSSYTFFNVAANHWIHVDFKPGVGSGYRTFTAADLEERTPIKKKPLYHRFSFSLINSSPQAATGLQINFGGSASTVIEIEGSAPFGSATTTDGKEWNFAAGTVAPGDTVVISGSNLRRPANIHRWHWIHHGLDGGNHGPFVPAGQSAAYPMPNPANIREELFQGGFGPDGLAVGIPRTDSARYYGWVRMDRGSQLQRSLVQRQRVHAAVARCFDFTGQKRTLTPLAQDNVMFANQAALKFNIRMSLLGVTPVGLRHLVFQDTVPNPLDGMTVGRIAEYADSLLSGYYAGTIHVCESIPLFGQVNGSIERINAAFAGAMDTVAYASGTVLAGVRGVDEVPFLRASQEIDTVAMEWDRSGPVAPPPPALTLFQNYPNPFNPATTVRFSLPADAIVSAVVYNQLGQKVAVLLDNEYMLEGEQETDFDGSALGSGLYFCRISLLTVGDPEEGLAGESETAVVRMLLVK